MDLVRVISLEAEQGVRSESGPGSPLGGGLDVVLGWFRGPVLCVVSVGGLGLKEVVGVVEVGVGTSQAGGRVAAARRGQHDAVASHRIPLRRRVRC